MVQPTAGATTLSPVTLSLMPGQEGQGAMSARQMAGRSLLSGVKERHCPRADVLTGEAITESLMLWKSICHTVSRQSRDHCARYPPAIRAEHHFAIRDTVTKFYFLGEITIGSCLLWPLFP